MQIFISVSEKPTPHLIRVNSIPKISIPDEEIEITGIRASGPGGQHGDKAATAVHLRFDIRASSLPERDQARLLALNDHRITKEGVVVIKAQEHRSREMNEYAARARLQELLDHATATRKPRRPTRPSLRAKARRINEKKQRGRAKSLRKPPDEDR